MGVVPVRTLVVWCPDWPLVAAGAPLDEAAAVLVGERVRACTPGARAGGVRVGQRRREAQARCPTLALLDHDPGRDGRAFERVVTALEALVPRVEVAEPGTCAIPTRGPSRYWGGDEALAERAWRLAADALAGAGRPRVGVADGPFAAALAARRARADHPAGSQLVVAPGEAAAFLDGLPVAALAGGAGALGPDLPELVDVFGRLGLRTLGAVAALPAADVVGRFGAEGRRAHRLASGLDERPPDARALPPDLTVEAELDPPAERVDVAAFRGKALADELHGHLDRRGLACTRLVVTLETEHGERLERVWRHEGALGPGAVADRVRWQLEGWLGAPEGSPNRPTAGVALVRLAPDEVVPAGDRQEGFWGGGRGAAERAARALARVQGLLGPGSVSVVEERGGRNPGDAAVLVPAEAVDLVDRAVGRSAGRHPAGGRPPWPGRVPSPSPATVHPEPRPAEVHDAHGQPVAVSGRGQASAAPARLSVAGAPWREVVAWAGPWPVDERWWDRGQRRRQARFQVVDDGGSAHLVALEGGRWWVLATYD